MTPSEDGKIATLAYINDAARIYAMTHDQDAFFGRVKEVQDSQVIESHVLWNIVQGMLFMYSPVDQTTERH